MRDVSLSRSIYSWKEVMGWPRYKRKMLKRMIDGRSVFPRIEGWLGRGRLVGRMGRMIGSGILFGKWTGKWEVVLDSERDYIEVWWGKGNDGRESRRGGWEGEGSKGLVVGDSGRIGKAESLIVGERGKD